jgi:hypothetical protein
VGDWKGQISTIDGVFTFTLSFSEEGNFEGDGKYVYGDDEVQSMIAGKWGIQEGHIQTSGTRKTTGDIRDAAGHEAIGKAYNADKRIIEINDKKLVFSVPDSTQNVSLDKVSVTPTPTPPTPSPALTLSQMQARWKPILFDVRNSLLVKSYVPNFNQISDLMTAIDDNERISQAIDRFANQVSDAALTQWLTAVRYNFGKIQGHLMRVDEVALRPDQLMYLDRRRKIDLQVAENMRVEVLRYLTEITKGLGMADPGFANTQAASVPGAPNQPGTQ